MATVRLEFELDSEVYPELHAALSALRNTRARSERMRQLAAAGLVWEKVRLHGAAAVMVPTPTVEARPDVVTRADVSAAAPAEAGPLPALERRAAKRTRTNAGEKRADAEFVDLAINAEPRPIPASRPERRGARPSRQEVEQVIRELPVLMDVVADVRPLSPAAEAREDEAPVPWAAMNAYPDDVPAAAHDVHGDSPDDDTLDLDLDMPPATLHVTALSHKPATRSRLMRMKERGLFKNG